MTSLLVQYQGAIGHNTAVWDRACAGDKISSGNMEKKNDLATTYAKPQLLKSNGYETK